MNPLDELDWSVGGPMPVIPVKPRPSAVRSFCLVLFVSIPVMNALFGLSILNVNRVVVLISVMTCRRLAFPRLDVEVVTLDTIILVCLFS